jgi:hypothetical protein
MFASRRFLALLCLALLAGLLIGWVDTRPTWDDAGITAGAVFLATFLLGAGMPKGAWVWALLVGGSVLAWNVVLHGSFGSAIGLLFAFAGAYGGAALSAAIRSIIGKSPGDENP